MVMKVWCLILNKSYSSRVKGKWWWDPPLTDPTKPLKSGALTNVFPTTKLSKLISKVIEQQSLYYPLWWVMVIERWYTDFLSVLSTKNTLYYRTSLHFSSHSNQNLDQNVFVNVSCRLDWNLSFIAGRSRFQFSRHSRPREQKEKPGTSNSKSCTINHLGKVSPFIVFEMHTNKWGNYVSASPEQFSYFIQIRCKFSEACKYSPKL